MKLTIPTFDFSRLFNKLRPLKTVSTAGFTYPIYTMEARGNKIRLIVSDGTTLVAYSEVFAKITEEGIASFNGADFSQIIAKILPTIEEGKNGSQEISLESSGATMTLKTKTFYSETGKSVNQQRKFTLVSKNLSAQDDFNPGGPNAVRIIIKGSYLSEVFKVLSRVIASYTSDIAALSGVLLRCKNQRLLFAVSDGFRVVEIGYPEQVNHQDFDLLLPKITCNLLHALLCDGDELEITSDSSRARFKVNTGGLTTMVVSSLINAFFPPYDSVFQITGTEVLINTKVFYDNISNVRKILEEAPYRIILNFSKDILSISSFSKTAHATFENSGIPLMAPVAQPTSIVVNSMLLESSVSILSSDHLCIKIPGGGKPIILDNRDPELPVRIALALADNT